MNTVQMTVAVAQHNAENSHKVPSKYLNDKAWRVINSCQTPRQARGAMIYLDLMAEQYPQMDILPLKRELELLFDQSLS